MDCHEFENRLSEFFDGELDSAACSQAIRHLASCNACTQNYMAALEIRKQLIAATIPSPDPNLWNRIESRLSGNPVELPRPSANEKRQRGPKRWSYAIPSLVFVVTATVIAIAIWPKPHSDPIAHSNNKGKLEQSHTIEEKAPTQLATTIDFESLLRATEIAPTMALGLLTNQAKEKISTPASTHPSHHFVASLNESLPTGVIATDTRVLRLPQCNCGPGQCKCGPLGCICTACLCQREDGSHVLLIEHCETQDFSFGNLTSVSNHQHKNAGIDLLLADQLFAVSWVFDHRRRTVFGLDSATEALAYPRSSIEKR